MLILPNRRALHLVLGLLGVSALASGCAPQKPAVVETARFDASLPLDEVMGHVIDPAAFGYWKGSGTEETEAGTKDLSPTTPEGWEALENSAAVLIEAGNMLQLPGRVRDPAADWNRYAQQLSERAVAAKTAAEKHDKAAVFEEGARLFQVCEACHQQYVIQPDLKANGRPVGLPLPPWPKDFPAKPLARSR